MREQFYTALSRVRAFLRPGAGDSDFDQEMAAHLAMAEDEKVRRGVSPEEARREARIELGGLPQVREAARAARGLPWLEAFWLDGKIGIRMLRKSWGLTLVGGLAMALTIGLGASIFTIWETFRATRLPLDEGQRIVAIQPFDRVALAARRTTPLPDFLRWRDTLRSVEHVSAMRPIGPEAITPVGPIGSVVGAEITATAFQVARVQPMLGRVLFADDEREGAQPVAVISHDIWRNEFSSDPAVVGKSIQLDGTPHVVVGVMPAGFRFPINQRVWTPLKTDVIGGSGDEVFVFARLAPGATLERAHAEVLALGLLPEGTAPGRSGSARDSTARPQAQRQPRVVAYAAGVFPDVHDNRWASSLLFLLGALLLVPPCANIAILVYARTLTRRDEFAARSALGASRGRIVMQLFVELLLLAGAAGFAGLLIARQFSGRIASIVMPGSTALPFWMDLSPSYRTLISVAGFSLLAAAIAGAIPAFQATRRWRRSGLQALGNRGAEARLGRTWTALLATQIALSLAIIPSGLEMSWGIFRPLVVGPSVAVDEFLTGWLLVEGDASGFDTNAAEAIRQLSSAPGISGVTASAAGLMEEPASDIEVEGSAESGTRAKFNSVDRGFFDVLGVRFLAGRAFDARDLVSAGAAVIVNRTFVNEVVGGASPLGRRVRYIDRERTDRTVPPPRWYEIIGVVEDFPAENDGPMLYHPLVAAAQPLSITIHAASDLGSAAGRLRDVSAAFPPNVRLGGLQSLDEMYWQRRTLDHTLGFVLGAVMLLVLLFSTAGIYTLMAFIVAQRWRELGVRSALGAEPRRLVLGILARAAVPLVLGAIAGSVLAQLLESSLPIAEAGGRIIPGVVPASAAFLAAAGVLAVTRPARRAVRINPTEALRVN